MKIIRGKKVLITGAGSGIGRSITLALAAEGADLYLLDINAATLAETAREAKKHGVEVVTAICDLSQSSEISAAVKTLLATWDRLNILVNNAGVIHFGPTHRMTDNEWQRLLSVNLLAPIQLVRELLPTLAAQEEAHILNVASLLGLVTARKMAAYQTSKFALVGFSAALRAEYAGRGFGVTVLCPGFVRTPLLKEYARQLQRNVPSWIYVTPDEVAGKAIAAIRANRALQVVSWPGWIYWWVSRLSPGLVDWLSREGWRRRGKVKI